MKGLFISFFGNNTFVLNLNRCSFFSNLLQQHQNTAQDVISSESCYYTGLSIFFRYEIVDPASNNCTHMSRHKKTVYSHVIRLQKHFERRGYKLVHREQIEIIDSLPL